jgi:branched-chain amino acid transport system permease protein
MKAFVLAVMGVAGFGAAFAVPWFGSDYTVSLFINLLMYANLAVAWSIFCGSARLVSLATSAFFGVGCYTAAVLSEQLAWPVLLPVAAILGGALALIIGLCTLRLSGMYFVIFSFGVSELIRQIVTWYESKIAGSVGRYVFVDVAGAQIYWQLLVLLGVVCVGGLLLMRSRIGFALRLIGSDEVAARSCGINTVVVRLTVLVGSSAIMAVVGAIVGPRWTYIDPSIAFNPIVSFQVVVMSLLGGIAPFYGALLGAIPLVFLFEVLNKYVPNYFSIVLGCLFLGIVYALPGGLMGLLRRLRKSPDVARA